MDGVPYGSSEAVQGLFEEFFPVVSSAGLGLESTMQGLQSGIETAVSMAVRGTAGQHHFNSHGPKVLTFKMHKTGIWQRVTA